jgi:lysophospholipase L1-like esterase
MGAGPLPRNPLKRTAIRDLAARLKLGVGPGLALLAAGAIAGGCGGASSPEPAKKANPEKALSVVALGDSETTGAGDASGVGWVGRYARLLRARFHVDVKVSNLAVEGKTSAQLLSDMRQDPRTRTAIGRAQVVLLGIGGADLNAGDDAFQAGECRGEECYAPVLKTFGKNVDGVAAAIRRQRSSDVTVLRAITPMNPLTGAEDVIPPFLKPIATRIGVYQARTANHAICRAMSSHEGRCVELLERFNGPDGTEDAYAKGLLNHKDCCYPNARGQELIARRLVESGLAPLR